jgi:heptosyltransferase-2
MTTPALRALRKSFPQAEISLLVGKWSAQILNHNPNITRLIEFEDAIVHKKQIINIVKMILNLRSYKFDCAIIFHPSPFIHLIAMCAGIKKRYGLSRKGGSFFLTASAEMNTSSEFYFPVNFLNVLGTMGIKSSNIAMEVFFTEKDCKALENILIKKGIIDYTKLILIAAGGASNPKEKISARIWPTHYYIQLIKKLINEFPQYTIVLCGGQNDKLMTSRIHAEIPLTVDVSGETDLQQLSCLVRWSKAIVCNDSAILHIALALRCSPVGIFGPTSVKTFVPTHQSVHCLQSPLSCSPCYRLGVFPGCKKGFSCMNAITPDQVYMEVHSLLQF